MTDTSRIRFSIVIPSYNYAGYLAGAISSVLEQNHPDVEILIIDDASTDNTAEIADTFKGQITYYRLEKNRGAAGAWSYGLQLARGSYICKLDADDMQLPGYLEAVEHAFLSDPEIGLVATSVKIKDEKTGKVVDEILTNHDVVLSTDELRTKLLHEFFFRMPGLCLRRSITFPHAMPREDLYQIHDWEYIVRVTKGYKGYLISKPLAIYRLHEKSITSTARQNSILENDCEKWINTIYTDGKTGHDKYEKNNLTGSLAVLVMRRTQIPYTPKLLYMFICKYREAIRIGRPGGWTAFGRLNLFIITQAFSVLHRKIRILIRLPCNLFSRFIHKGSSSENQL